MWSYCIQHLVCSATCGVVTQTFSSVNLKLDSKMSNILLNVRWIEASVEQVYFFLRCFSELFYQLPQLQQAGSYHGSSCFLLCLNNHFEADLDKSDFFSQEVTGPNNIMLQVPNTKKTVSVLIRSCRCESDWTAAESWVGSRKMTTNPRVEDRSEQYDTSLQFFFSFTLFIEISSIWQNWIHRFSVCVWR